MKDKTTYSIVECFTHNSFYVDQVDHVAGPFATRRRAEKELAEIAKLYEKDDDVMVDDGHICIDDGPTQRTILIMEI